MAWNGSGTYVLPSAYTPAVNGTIIDAADYNGALTDIATGITNTLAKDGQNAATANIPMGNFIFTGLGAGTVATHSVNYGQVMNTASASIASAATVDLSSVLATDIVLTGTTTISSFGTAANAGIIKFIRAAAGLTLTHSGSLLCPGSTDLVLSASDSFILTARTTSAWAVSGIFRAATSGTALNDVGNATANATRAHAAYAINWGWTFGATTATGMTFAGTGSNATLVAIDCASVSKGLYCYSGSNTLLEISPSNVRLGSQDKASLASGNAYISTGATTGAASSGNVYLTPGNADAGLGTGGSVYISAGTGVTPGSINLTNAASDAAVVLNSTGIAINGTKRFIFANTHLYVDDTSGTPSITAGGGSGAAIRGNNIAGEITFGTGSPTSVTITFATAYAVAPMCVISGTQSGQVLHYAATTSTLQILSSTAFSSGTKATYFLVSVQ